MKLKNIQKIPNDSKRYDIQTESENFFANGILVHNSLLIADYVNDQFSMRTRGTTSYITQNNSSDFEQLIIKYPHVLTAAKKYPELSLHLEIVTPNNLIVIPYPEIDFTFLGAINKDTMEPLDFNSYQQLGWMMEVPMPELHTFKNLSEVISSVKEWKDKEGVVISYNNFKNRVKCKADLYLVKHRLKSELNSENNFVDLYVDEGMPDYQTFFEIIEKVTDFETATAFQGRISKAVGASQEVKRILSHMDEFVKDIRNLKSRKEQAETIIRSYGNTNRASFVFCKLDNKPLNNDQIIKLFWQVLKK